MSDGLLPWHLPSWERAWAALGRGAHALLVAGAQGLGKSQFAVALATARLCHRRSATMHACGQCESCRWIAAGTHPDLSILEPLVEDTDETPREAAARGKPISVDQVRALTDSLGLTAHRDEGRVIVVRPAEAMNVPAANALLKSLEEPPPGVLFLLVSDRPAMLLPTVRSRCQVVPVRLRDASAAEAWLQEQRLPAPELGLALSGGAPLQAVAISADPEWEKRPALLRALVDVDADPLRIAERFKDLAPALVLGWLQRLTYDVVSMRLCGRVRYNLDLQSEIAARAPRADPIRLSRVHRRFVSMQRIANHPLNSRLFLEKMFIDTTGALDAAPDRATERRRRQ